MNTNKQHQPRTILFNATVFFSIVGFWTSFAYSVGTSLSENGKLVLSALALILFFCVPFAFYFLRAFTQMARESHQASEPEYRPVTHENRPYRALAAREVFIPRYTEMGQIRPYGYDSAATPAPAMLTTNDAVGQRIAIDERILSRFLSCKTPSRAEWTGAKEGYTRAAAFCIEQGLATRLPNGALQWCTEFANEDTRLEWAQSITQ